MGQKVCTSCAGTGHPVTVNQPGNGFTRDYNMPCSSCGGSGWITIPDPPANSGNAGNGGGCVVLFVPLIAITLTLIVMGFIKVTN